MVFFGKRPVPHWSSRLQPRFPWRSAIGWVCLLLTWPMMIDYNDAASQHIAGVTPPKHLFFKFDQNPIWAFWLVMGLFAACAALCSIDLRIFPRKALTVRDVGWRTSFLSTLCVALPNAPIGPCIALSVMHLASGLAHIFP